MPTLSQVYNLVKIRSVRISYFCLCGDSMSGSFTPQMLPGVEKAWREVHSGDGHGKTDQKTCAKNRHKKERAENNRSFQHQTSFADGGFVRQTYAAGAMPLGKDDEE